MRNRKIEKQIEKEREKRERSMNGFEKGHPTRHNTTQHDNIIYGNVSNSRGR